MSVPKRGYDTGDLLAQMDADGFMANADEVSVVQGGDEPVVDTPADPEPQPEPAPTPVPEPQTQEPEARQEKPWKEDFDLLQNRVELEQQHRARNTQPEQQQAQTEKSIREITDTEEYYSRFEQLETQARSAFSAVRAMEKANAMRELEALKADHPDIVDHIPSKEIDRAIEMRLQSGNIGTDWKQGFLKVYDLATEGKRFSSVAEENARLKAEIEELKKQKSSDELASKRAQKNELQAAGSVPPGGSSFQSPVVPERSSGPQRGYKAAAKNFERDVFASLGG